MGLRLVNFIVQPSSARAEGIILSSIVYLRIPQPAGSLTARLDQSSLILQSMLTGINTEQYSETKFLG